jgi:hypothetical protein
MLTRSWPEWTVELEYIGAARNWFSEREDMYILSASFRTKLEA